MVQGRGARYTAGERATSELGKVMYKTVFGSLGWGMTAPAVAPRGSKEEAAPSP